MGTSLRAVTACQWMVVNGTVNAIGDQVMDPIISYFGVTSSEAPGHE
jgi:hypothetical protein